MLLEGSLKGAVWVFIVLTSVDGYLTERHIGEKTQTACTTNMSHVMDMPDRIINGAVVKIQVTKTCFFVPNIQDYLREHALRGAELHVPLISEGNN